MIFTAVVKNCAILFFPLWPSTARKITLIRIIVRVLVLIKILVRFGYIKLLQLSTTTTYEIFLVFSLAEHVSFHSMDEQFHQGSCICPSYILVICSNQLVLLTGHLVVMELLYQLQNHHITIKFCLTHITCCFMVQQRNTYLQCVHHNLILCIQYKSLIHKS